MKMIHAFQEGGVFMYFILIFGLFTMSFIYDRFINLYKKFATPPDNFRADILKMISKRDWVSADTYLMPYAKSTALGRIIKEGIEIRAVGGGDEEVQARMDEQLGHEISVLEKRSGFLAMFGNVATLLGLLGTISGMIVAFAAVAKASPADRATQLSLGISEAMNCTAFGLLVAIPALVTYAIFQNRLDTVIGNITRRTTEIFHDIIFRSEASPKTTVKSNGSGIASQSHDQHPSH